MWNVLMKVCKKSMRFVEQIWCFMKWFHYWFIIFRNFSTFLPSLIYFSYVFWLFIRVLFCCLFWCFIICFNFLILLFIGPFCTLFWLFVKHHLDSFSIILRFSIWKAKSSSQITAFFNRMFVNWARAKTMLTRVTERGIFFHQISENLP